MGERFKTWVTTLMSDKEVPSNSFSFLFKDIFAQLPPPDETLEYHPSSQEVSMLKYCCNLSKMVYIRPQRRDLLPEVGSIVFDERQSSKYTIPYFITNSDKLNRIFITCRGSYCLNDFIVDLELREMPWKGGYVHYGVYRTAINFYNSIKYFVKKLSEENNNRPVTITGHSLGGGCAALAIKMFHDEFPEMDVSGVVFAPCATLSRNLWDMTKDCVKAYCLDGDFVPFLTLYNLEQLDISLLPPFWAKIVKRAKKVHPYHTKAITPEIPPVGFDPFLAAPPSIQDVLKTTEHEKQGCLQLCPPGEPYLFVRKDASECIIQLRKIQNIEYFGKWVNTFNELMHMMGTYRKWIVYFCESRESGRVGGKLPDFSDDDD